MLQDRPTLWQGLLLLVPAALVALIHWRLRGYFYFGDEGETVVAAQMMAAGDRLYSQIFNHHGPLTFLPQYLLETVGLHGMVMGRMVIAGLQWLALAALYFSPLLRDTISRIVAVVLAATVMVVYLPEMLGFTMQYHVLGGMMLMVVMAQFAIPTIAGMPLARWQIASGSLLIASLPFLAITYAPLAGLLWLATLRRENLRTMLIAAVAAVLFNLAFLALTGSFRGYWATHFYMNSAILQWYAGNPTPIDMARTALMSMISSFEAFACVMVGVVGAVMLAKREGKMPWRTVLLAMALATTLLRGNGPAGLYAIPLLYAMMALPALFFSSPVTVRHAPVIVGIAMVLCVARLGIAAFGEDRRYEARKLPLDTPFGDLAQAITLPTDRIISYSFSNHEYLAAHRLPASAQYFYLPWQADYEKKPVLGINLNACRDIQQNRPKLIKLDRWKVYGVHSWESYGGCVEAIIARDYFPVPGIVGAYVRNDIQLPGNLNPEKTHEAAKGG